MVLLQAKDKRLVYLSKKSDVDKGSSWEVRVPGTYLTLILCTLLSVCVPYTYTYRTRNMLYPKALLTQRCR